jgi:hypothetical protein
VGFGLHNALIGPGRRRMTERFIFPDYQGNAREPAKARPAAQDFHRPHDGDEFLQTLMAGLNGREGEVLSGAGVFLPPEIEEPAVAERNMLIGAHAQPL